MSYYDEWDIDSNSSKKSKQNTVKSKQQVQSTLKTNKSKLTKQIEKTHKTQIQPKQSKIKNNKQKRPYFDEWDLLDDSFVSTKNNNSSKSSYSPKISTPRKNKQNPEYDYSNPNFEYDSRNLSKFHIIVNEYTGDYTLLDKNLNIIDTMHKNYILHMFTRKFSLNKFKRELKRDYKLYKHDCRKKHIPIDKNFKYVNKKIKEYLSLCPDADYQILELLRRNITNLDGGYSNYQTACAQYLHELAVDIPYPERLPFDLNYVCNGDVTNSHRYIANAISYSQNPVEDFRQQLSSSGYRNSYLHDQHIEIVQPKKKLVAAKHVKAPNPINQDYHSR